MSLPDRHQLTGSREVRAETVSWSAGLLAQLDGETWNAGTLAGLSSTALDSAATRASLDPLDAAIVDDLERCACAAAAAYMAALVPGDGPVEAPGPGRRSVTVTREKLDRKKLEPAVQWRQGILAAAAVRHHALIDVLASFRPEHLRTVGRPAPSWFASEAAAVVATFRRDADAGDLLAAAMREADPDKVQNVNRDWILDVVVPELELGFRALDQDSAGFDRVMVQAVNGHHHYYGAAGKGHPHGQLALAPLAMACFGRDLGIHTTVESDYVPRWIIERGHARGAA